MKLLQQLHFGASQQLHFGVSQFLIFLQLLAQHVCRTCGAGAFGAACSLPEEGRSFTHHQNSKSCISEKEKTRSALFAIFNLKPQPHA